MAGRLEEITPLGWIDVKEDPWDYNCLLFQELFEEGQATINSSEMRHSELIWGILV